MKRWAPTAFEIPTTSPDSQRAVGWHSYTPGALFFHGIVFGTNSGVPQLDEYTLARLVCHYLVSTIPDEGLPEAARALEDCRNYYLEEVNRQPELPPAREIVKARVGRTYERPTFALAEE